MQPLTIIEIAKRLGHKEKDSISLSPWRGKVVVRLLQTCCYYQVNSKIWLESIKLKVGDAFI